MDILLVGLRLQLVGHCEHDQIGPGCSFGNSHDLQAFAFGFGSRGGAITQRNNNVLRATVAKVQGVSMALRAVAKNGHFHVLDQIHIAVAIIINTHFISPD